jgi:hypothetical protein
MARPTLGRMNQATAPHPVERRRTARQKSLLRGMIYFNNHRSALDCLIRDVSPYGARLVFPEAVSTPDAVDLHIPQKAQTLRAQVIWRHGPEIGVAFAQATQVDHAPDPADPGPGPSLAERVARLEVEIAGLKRILKKMKTDTGPEFDVA